MSNVRDGDGKISEVLWYLLLIVDGIDLVAICVLCGDNYSNTISCNSRRYSNEPLLHQLHQLRLITHTNTIRITTANTYIYPINTINMESGTNTPTITTTITNTNNWGRQRKYYENYKLNLGNKRAAFDAMESADQ